MGTLTALAAGVSVLAFFGLEYTSVFNGMAVRINKLVLVIAMTILLEGLIWMLLSYLSLTGRVIVPGMLTSLMIVGFSPFKHELTSRFWNRRYYGVHMLVGLIYVLLLMQYQ